MAHTSHTNPLHVTAEERIHPAFSKLARALIALSRAKLAEETADRPTVGADEAATSAEAGE